MKRFSKCLNMIETAYSYMAARRLASYTVRDDTFWLRVSRETIECGEGEETVLVMNRGYYQLSTIIENIILADVGEED